MSATLSAPAVMAQARAENFPVATRLLGRDARSHLLAIYGFARLTDDIGDEADGDRGALLDWLEAELDRVYSGEEADHPLLRRLAPTVHELALPRECFARLIEANRRDLTVDRYDTFEELLGYCRLSAAPVGELVLHVFGAATPDRIALSDRVCAGLQLTEHLQDVAEDYARGRIYVPREDLERFGCEEQALGARAASEPLRAAIAFEVSRAHGLLDMGARLVRLLPPRAAIAVAGFAGGGRAALRAIERAGCDVLTGPPRASRTAQAASILRTLAVGR